MQTLLFKVGSKKKCGRQRALNAAPPPQSYETYGVTNQPSLLQNGFIDLLFNVKSGKTQ